MAVTAAGRKGIPGGRITGLEFPSPWKNEVMVSPNEEATQFGEVKADWSDQDVAVGRSWEMLALASPAPPGPGSPPARAAAPSAAPPSVLGAGTCRAALPLRLVCLTRAPPAGLPVCCAIPCPAPLAAASSGARARQVATEEDAGARAQQHGDALRVEA